MQCKAFKFARLATSQFAARVEELNQFLLTVDVVGLPQVTASDEDGTVMFVFYTEKQQTQLKPSQPKTNKE
jgi:hypothetical protein